MNTWSYRIGSIILTIIFIVSCKSINSDLNIIEGKYVDENLYPTVVLLQDYHFDHDYTYLVCTGVVVSENVVLTAANCLINIKEDESSSTASYEITGRGVMVDGVVFGGSTPIVLEEFEKNFVHDSRIRQLKKKVNEDYMVSRSISRTEYEQKVLSLKKQLSNDSYNIGALIFDSISEDPPFKPLIERAKKIGKFFSLSKRVFNDGIVINDNQRSLFFLGYGFKGKYSDLNNLEDKEEGEGLGKLQLGYNSVKYSITKNEWFTTKPIKNHISKSLYNKSNITRGDYGGPLIYNNQIIGLASYGVLYDCDGNDVYLDPVSDKYIGIDSNGNKLDDDKCVTDPYCDKLFYSSSVFSSLTLGSSSKAVELLFKKIKEELEKKGLLENNNIIFSE